MKKFILGKFNFTLFSEGSTAGGEGGAEVSAEQTGGELQKKGGETVIYGKQTEEKPVAEVMKEEKPQEKAQNLKELRAKYDEFMADENMRKFMSDDTQKVINRRFRDNKAMAEQLTKQQSVIQRLEERYGESDLEALAAAIDNDSAIWEEAAADAGMNVEQFRNYKKWEREAKEARAVMENYRRREQAQQQYREWIAEAEEVKAEYPEFDLEEMLGDSNFKGLLGQRDPTFKISMKQIYEVCRPQAREKRIAEQTTREVTDNIKARGARPIEGAMKGGGGIVYKTDVTKLTKKDREEIAQRAARGEKITF